MNELQATLADSYGLGTRNILLAFRDACLAQKIQLGRDFLPLQETNT